MTKSILSTLLAVAVFSGSVVQADDKEKKSRSPHDQLKRLVGNYTTEMTSFYPDPSKPTKTKGKASFRMILAGKFVQQRYTGEVEGMKYNGIGTSGYDTAKKKYVGTWVDSLNTGIMHTEGSYDPKTHTLTEMGTMSTPMGEMKTKNVTKYVDKDNFVFTMYMIVPDG